MGDLVNSIGEVGLLQPIVVTPENIIISGHRRFKAIQSLGWTAKVVNFMVKGHTLGLMDKSMKENLRMGKNGMVQYMTMTESRNRSM